MVLVLTLKFLALKNTGFSPVKNTSQNYFDFFYLYAMQLFSADTTIFTKKILNLFFAHENIKTGPQKLLIISLFFTSTARLPKTPKPLWAINYNQYKKVSLLVIDIRSNQRQSQDKNC